MWEKSRYGSITAGLTPLFQLANASQNIGCAEQLRHEDTSTTKAQRVEHCASIYIYMCSSGDLKLALLEWCQSTDHPVDAMNYALKLHHHMP